MLNTKYLFSFHALILNNVEKEFADRYQSFGVRVTGANYVPPYALKVNDYMDELID